MAGIFPASTDGAIAPNPGDLANPIRAYPPAVAPADTAALYYGNGCDVRLRPEVLNSLISEIEAVVDEAKLGYQSSSQQNMEVAIRYLIQRGIPHAGRMLGGPFDYTLTLDPAPAQYSDYMLLVVVPEVSNNGSSRVNLNGLGYVNVVRRDGTPTEANDLLQNRPAVLLYYAGELHLIWSGGTGGAIIGVGEVDGWIRTDGNDDTGDGTANTPDKAFRTINGAMAKLAGRYAPSVDFQINLRFGIPGTYEAGRIAACPARVQILGDVSNASAYQIAGTTGANNTGWCVYVSKSLYAIIRGVTMLIDQPGVQQYALSVHDSPVLLDTVTFKANIANNKASFITALGNSPVYLAGNIRMLGAGTIANAIICWSLAQLDDAGGIPGHFMTVTNCAFSSCFIWLQDLALAAFGPNAIAQSGNSGPSYAIASNSVLRKNGVALPGNGTGTASSGAQLLA